MKRILVFKHMPSQNPGIFRQFASDYNVEFSEIDLHAGDAIPDLAPYDGLWAMGGSMNVWEQDEFPWLIDEIDVIADVVSRKMPFLGICLGHQLLAEAMGGSAGPTEDHEFGLIEVSPTAAGVNHPFLAGLPKPSLWVNAHRAEVTQPPPQAVILAQSEKCANHIMQVTELAYSCQFHPEVCEHTVTEWMKIPGIPEALNDLLGEQGVNYFRSSIADYLDRHNRAADQLFRNWLNLVYPAE
jgi:GMP synthase-like glutamine amidotransferase